MIDRVDHRLFNGFIGKVGDSGGLGATALFDHSLTQIVAADVIKHLAHHARERSLEDLLGKFVAARAIGKPDHINLGDGKEAMGFTIEKE